MLNKEMIIWHGLGMFHEKILCGLLFKKHIHIFLNIKQSRDFQQINAIHNTIPTGEKVFSGTRDNFVTW